MGNILVIDDEPGIRSVLKDILEDEGHVVYLAEDGFEGLASLKQEPIDVVILDVWLPNMGGIDVLKEIKKEYEDIQVVVISGHANIDIAVKAVKLGAFDFLEKPLSLDKVLTIIKNALEIEQLKKENRSLKTGMFLEDDMVGSSKPMEDVRGRINQSAESDAKILILGDNGTGKELIARSIHMKSKRRDKKFIEVNCAAIPDTLIESELFGHEKGAFTSAVSTRRGKFEAADGGTLFLDEIADMSLSAQAKVLRAIQEMKFERVGGEKQITVDVRIIAATNKDIQKEIEEGNFREDLYFRLNVIPITIPPLKDRISDLEPLINYFMKKFLSDEDYSRRSISKAGMGVLREYNWPGNIRELKNFVERITVMSDEQEISEESVHYFLGESVTPAEIGCMEEFTRLKLNEAKDLFEKKYLALKLDEHGYNISQTAQSIGIYPSNLHGKIKKLDLEIKK